MKSFLIAILLCAPAMAIEPTVYIEGEQTLGTTAEYSRISGETYGVGNSIKVAANSKLKGRTSTVWSALPLSERVSGAFQKFHDFNLFGIDRPAIGTLVTYGAGSGSGEHTFRDRTWRGFQTALQFGEYAAMNGCDSTKVDRNWFVDCDDAIAFRNVMSMTHPIRDVNVDSCGNVFQIYAGGKCKVDGVFITGKPETESDGAVFNIHGMLGLNAKQTKIVEVGIGSNNNWFKAENVVLDDSVGSRMALLRISRSLSLPYSFKIEDGSIAYDNYRGDGKCQIELWNPFIVTIDNVHGLQAGTFRIHYDPSKPMGTIVVTGCNHVGTGIKNAKATGDVNGDSIFDALDLFEPGCSGYGHTRLISRDCFTAAGEPMPPLDIPGVK